MCCWPAFRVSRLTDTQHRRTRSGEEEENPPLFINAVTQACSLSLVYQSVSVKKTRHIDTSDGECTKNGINSFSCALTAQHKKAVGPMTDGFCCCPFTDSAKLDLHQDMIIYCRTYM